MRGLILLVSALFLFQVSIVNGQDADSLKMQGDEAYKAKEYDKAIELYKASLKINGKNWQVHEALGNAYFKAKRYTEAAASYAEALGYNPQLTSAYYNIGYSYLKAGLFNEAIKYLEKYATLAPNDPDGYYRLGEAYYSVGEKENAKRNYEKFLSIANKDVSQKKIDDAREKLKELSASASQSTQTQSVAIATQPSPSISVPAPSVSPSIPAVGTPAGSVSISPIGAPSSTPNTPASSGQPSAPPSATITPSSAGVQTQSGQTSTGGTAQDVAANNPESMMKLYENDPAIEIIKEADGHLANGNYRLAISTYRDALIKNPNSIQAHYNLGIALAKVERYEQAIAEWEKVLQLDPSNAGARENINRARAKMSGAGGLASTTASASAPKPESSGAQNQSIQKSPVDELLDKAKKANGTGDYASAVKYIDELLTMKKDVAEAYVVKGDAYLGMGRYLEAINEYKKALAVNPQLATPLFGMAEAYRLLAKTDMAIQYYKLFLNSPAQDRANWRVERASKMLKALESIR